MDDLTFPVLLVFLGFGALFVALELFVTPGVGIKGFLGFGMIVFAVAFAFYRHGAAKGGLALLIAATALAALGWAAQRYVGRKLVLSAAVASPPAADEDLAGLVGAEGEALSPLRPAGIAHLGARRVDVTCEGEFVERGTRVRVVSVEGNRVTVERA